MRYWFVFQPNLYFLNKQPVTAQSSEMGLNYMFMPIYLTINNLSFKPKYKFSFHWTLSLQQFFNCTTSILLLYNI